VRDVIRDSIGFQGLLMSDDISMGALSGSVGERTSAAIAAGCDLVLHCNGEMPEMLAVAAEAPLLAGAAARSEFLKLMTGAWQPARGYA
jgi:beta-N-acetylhexosaminidase